ncbi:MAG TPA: LEA type 2 family protein [Polyangia bacterium]|jgi:LEA14-like dessication related protein
MIRRLLLVACLAALAGGCIPARFVRFEAREVRAVKVLTVREDAADLVLTAVVVNPNPMAARVRSLSYKIFVAERLLGRGARAGAFDVAAHGEAVVDLPVRVAFADIPADLPAAVSGPDVPYRAEVAVDVTSRLGDHHFDLNRKGTVRIADAARMAVMGDFAARVLQVRGVRLLPIQLDGVTVVADLEVRNLFPFPLEIRRVEYAVSLAGAPLGEGRHDQPIVLPARGKAAVAMKLKVPLTSLGTVARAIGQGGTDVRVTGRAYLAPIAGISVVPFDVRPDPALLRR